MQVVKTLMYRQANEFRAKLLRRRRACWVFAVGLWLAAPSTLAAEVRIHGKNLWRNEKKTLSENVVVEKGAALVLEGTTLHFQCTKPKEYGITVKAGGSLIIRKGSVIRGQSPELGTFLYAEDDKGPHHIEARDSSFINLGTTRRIYLDTWQRPGVRLKYTDSTSGFWNCTFDGGPGIAAMHVSGLRIEGNTFRYKNKPGKSACGTAVFISHSGPVYVHRNTFESIDYAIHTQFTHDVQITGNVLKNCCYPYSRYNSYGIHLRGGPDKDLYVAFNRLINVENNIYLNQYVNDTLVEYNYINDTERDATGPALPLGKDYNRRNVMRRNRSDSNHTSGEYRWSGGIITHTVWAQQLGRYLVYDSRLADIRGGPGLWPIGADMVFSNISFSVAPDGGNSPGFIARRSERKVPCRRCLFRNLSFSKFKTGMRIRDAHDCLFCDIRLNEIKGTHIQFSGNNSNLKFINVKFDPAKVVFKNDKDVFRPGWYADVLVTDAGGRPVQGATVTVTNEADKAVGAINRKGEPVAEFLTGKDGHTIRPGAAVRREVVGEAFDLKPDKPYRFAGWIRTRGDRGQDRGTKGEANYVKAYAILYELDGQGRPLAGHPLYVRGRSEWVLREDGFTTCPQTRRGRVELFVYGWGDHAAWFDDLSVKSGDGPNLLANPGFEAEPGKRGWPAADGHVMTWDNTEKHSGKRSCRLVCRTWSSADARTMALCGYSQTKAGRTDYAYTITAAKGTKSGSKKGVKPDTTWYRTDPAKPPVTIAITVR